MLTNLLCVSMCLHLEKRSSLAITCVYIYITYGLTLMSIEGSGMQSLRGHGRLQPLQRYAIIGGDDTGVSSPHHHQLLRPPRRQTGRAASDVRQHR